MSHSDLSRGVQCLGSYLLLIRQYGRDENAAKNIQAVGASTVELGDVSRAVPAIAV